MAIEKSAPTSSASSVAAIAMIVLAMATVCAAASSSLDRPVVGAAAAAGSSGGNNIRHTSATLLKEWDVDSSADDIRCFCNMPKCITAGYMCRTARSRHGGCYWEQGSGRDQSTRDTRHGCLELLKDEFAEPKCNQTLPRPSRTNGSAAAATVAPVLLCCHEDMCNHVDRPERVEQPSAGERLNRTATEFIGDRRPTTVYATGHHHADGASGTFEKQLMFEQHREHSGATPDIAYGTAGRDGWFRTATIIFPIGGAVILFVLIALAVRILRHDDDTVGLDQIAGGGSGKSLRHRSMGGGGSKHALNGPDAYTINQQQLHHQLQQQQQPLSHQHMLSNQHMLPAAHGQLLLHNNYRKTAPALIANDLKNVTLSKKNQLKQPFEYSLLPQRCFDAPSQQQRQHHPAKATNAAAAAANYSHHQLQQQHASPDVNLTTTAAAVASAATLSGAGGGNHGYKVYEKDTLSATPYWTTAGAGKQ